MRSPQRASNYLQQITTKGAIFQLSAIVGQKDARLMEDAKQCRPVKATFVSAMKDSKG